MFTFVRVIYALSDNKRGTSQLLWLLLSFVVPAISFEFTAYLTT
ncbi:hypothetical protein VCR31J2_1310142 [Vibrio coralliirubri]|uniref:Uncharacterized protein n=1 Tax=Vibrio coralliirubri TaxID=1516159 RepID=A0AA86XBZ4_9VIBR|nr:hypothetical protein VCR31J2_1310142 [Vibrio coralliirubri]